MPSIPIGSMATREIALKRRTVTGKVVKEIQFKCITRQAPRSKAWVPGVNLPSLEDCLQSVPPPTAWRDVLRLLSCGWFHAGGWDDDEAIDMADVYRQICLFDCLLAVAVQGLLRDTIHMGNEDRKGWAALFFGLSLLMLVSSAFHSLVHISFSQKMSSDAQIQVFNTLYKSRWHLYFSPLRTMQYGMIAGLIGGLIWIIEFVSAAYFVVLAFSGTIVGGFSIYGTLAIIHAGLGVLEAETLHYGEHVSLDWTAVRSLLTAYEEDCGAEFMSPAGFAAFAGACVLKSGCDADEICEFSYVTRMRMDGLVNQRIEEVATKGSSEVKEGQTDVPPGSVMVSAVGPKITRGRPSIKGMSSIGGRRGSGGRCFVDSGPRFNLPKPPAIEQTPGNSTVKKEEVSASDIERNRSRSRAGHVSDDSYDSFGESSESVQLSAARNKGKARKVKKPKQKSVSFVDATKPAGMDVAAEGSDFSGGSFAAPAAGAAVATNAVFVPPTNAVTVPPTVVGSMAVAPPASGNRTAEDEQALLAESPQPQEGDLHGNTAA